MKNLEFDPREYIISVVFHRTGASFLTYVELGSVYESMKKYRMKYISPDLIWNPHCQKCVSHGFLTVWTSNEIESSIFHNMFLHCFVAGTQRYLWWKNRSCCMKDNRDNVSTRVKPKDFDGVDLEWDPTQYISYNIFPSFSSANWALSMVEKSPWYYERQGR